MLESGRYPRSLLGSRDGFGSGWVLRTACVSISRSSFLVLGGSRVGFRHCAMDSIWDAGGRIKPRGGPQPGAVRGRVQGIPLANRPRHCYVVQIEFRPNDLASPLHSVPD